MDAIAGLVPSPPPLPSPLEELDELRDRLSGGFAVFSDFDGTLAPIVDRPEDARLPAETRNVLADLAEQMPVAVVSGRQVEDVRDRVAIEAITYVGDHGFTVRGPVQVDGLPRPDGLADELAAARRELADELSPIAGVRVEAKRFSLAVHHRQAAPEAGHQVRAAVAQAVDARSLLRSREGRQVVEVEPAVDWDKGHVVRALLDADASGDRSAVYLGDDTTDERAFAALTEDDAGVLVADEPRQTAADFRLARPDEVRSFLRELAACLDE